ncbi:DUF3644 domain-containing protein [Flavobacterium sp.]|jgi:hypothetical protein|uniref:DUF3644 domain-containing protein n=1 Tax=Flavobacterium sp. TaxID=239 RepID=UPI0037C0F5C5
MRKRRSPIAKNLLKNSVAGMFSAIEVHNKPIIAYRYETVVLLVLNSWELVLKAYLYKYHKTVKLFHKDGTTKQFENCLNITVDKIGKDFIPISENLIVLYEYRNQVAHFYLEELNPILFSLISKSIIFYSKFIKLHFKVDLSEEANLILLPIGFKRPISPVDYISTNSVNSKASLELKEFLQSIVNASRRLNDVNIEETIFSDFKMNLTNVTRTTNADLIAGIDNTKKNELVVTTIKESKKIIVSNSGDNVNLTRDKSQSQGTLLYEELQDGIFDEINNIVDANKILARNDSKFVLGSQLYYRIYSERQYVNFNIEVYELLAKTALLDFNAPFLYWFTKLPGKNAAEILLQLYHQGKANKIMSLNRMSVLLGDGAAKKLQAKFADKFKGLAQKPLYVYSQSELIKSKQTDPVLKCLKASPGKMILSKTYSEFIKDPKLSKSTLSKECFKIFNEESDQKAILRELDFLAYGDQMVANAELVNEFVKQF